MSVTGKCVLVVEAPLAEAFQKFIDCGSWSKWMPAAFEPVRVPKGPLAEGATFTVKIPVGALKPVLPVKIFRVQANREVAWGGGLQGVLRAEHCFFFEDAGAGRTRIRSEETFSGLLTMPKPVGKRIQKEVERVGEAQLSAFGSYVKKAKA